MIVLSGFILSYTLYSHLNSDACCSWNSFWNWIPVKTKMWQYLKFCKWTVFCKKLPRLITVSNRLTFHNLFLLWSNLVLKWIHYYIFLFFRQKRASCKNLSLSNFLSIISLKVLIIVTILQEKNVNTCVWSYNNFQID